MRELLHPILQPGAVVLNQERFLKKKLPECDVNIHREKLAIASRVQNEDLSLEHFPSWVKAPALLSWESSELPRISHCSVCPVFFQLQKCQLKKKAQCESCKLSFIWGKNEDCSLGDCTSASSEKLLQRGKEESSARMWFWWRGNMCNQAHIFPKGVS